MLSVSFSFVQHQAVIIFINSKHNISSILIIFLLNNFRKAILNAFLAGSFPFFDFFTFVGKKGNFQENSGQLKTSHPSKMPFKKQPLHPIDYC
jgi:hypothetical protein